MIGKLPWSQDSSYARFSSVPTHPTSPSSSSRNSGAARRSVVGLSLIPVDLSASSSTPVTGSAAMIAAESSTGSSSSAEEQDHSTPSGHSSHAADSVNTFGPSSSSDAYVRPPARPSPEDNSSHKVNQQQRGLQRKVSATGERSIEHEGPEGYCTILSTASAEGRHGQTVLPSQTVSNHSLEATRSSQGEAKRLSTSNGRLEALAVRSLEPQSPFQGRFEPLSPQDFLSPLSLWGADSPYGLGRDSYFQPQGLPPPSRSLQPLTPHLSSSPNEPIPRPSMAEFPSRSKLREESKRWSDQTHADPYGYTSRPIKGEGEDFRSDALRRNSGRRKVDRDLSLPTGEDGEEPFGSVPNPQSIAALLKTLQRALAPYKVVAPVLTTVFFDFNLLFILITLALQSQDTSTSGGSSSGGSPRGAWGIASGAYSATSVAHVSLYLIKVYNAYNAQTSSSKTQPSADEAYLSYFHRLVLSCRSPSLHTMVKRVDQLGTRRQRTRETAWRWSQLWQFAVLQAPRLVMSVIVDVALEPAGTTGTSTTPSPSPPALPTSRDAFFFNPETGMLSEYSFAISLAYICFLSISILSTIWASIFVRYSKQSSSGNADEEEGDEEKRMEALAYGGSSVAFVASHPTWALDTQERVRLVLMQGRNKHANVMNPSQLDPLQSVMVTVTSPRPEAVQPQEREKRADYDTEEELAFSAYSHHRGSGSARKSKVSWLQTTPPLLPLALPARIHTSSPFEIPCSIGPELRVINLATPDPTLRKSDVEKADAQGVGLRKETSKTSITGTPGATLGVQAKAATGNSLSMDEDSDESPIETGTLASSSASTFLQRFASEERKVKRVNGPRPLHGGKEAFWETWFGSKGERWTKGEQTNESEIVQGQEEQPELQEGVRKRNPELQAAADGPGSSASVHVSVADPSRIEGSRNDYSPHPDSIQDLLLAYQKLTSGLSGRPHKQDGRSFGKGTSPSSAGEEGRVVRLWPAQTVEPLPTPAVTPEPMSRPDPHLPVQARSVGQSQSQSPIVSHVHTISLPSTDDSEEARIWKSFPEPTAPAESMAKSLQNQSSTESKDDNLLSPTHGALRRSRKLLSASGSSRPMSSLVPAILPQAMLADKLRVVNTDAISSRVASNDLSAPGSVHDDDHDDDDDDEAEEEEDDTSCTHGHGHGQGQGQGHSHFLSVIREESTSSLPSSGT